MSTTRGRAKGFGRNLLLLFVSFFCLSIATLVALSRLSPPRFEVMPYQSLMRQLAAEGQPPDRSASDHFMQLMEASVMAHQVSVEGPKRLLNPSAARPDAAIDYRWAWKEWNANDAQRSQALEAFMLLYANGFAEKVEMLAAGPSVIRDLAHTVFLARGAQEDEHAVKSLNQVLLARMLVAAEERQDARLITAFDQSLALGRACALQPRPSNWYLGAECVLQALSHVRTLVVHDALKEETARELLSVMDRRLPLPEISRVVRARQYGSINTLAADLSGQSAKRGPQSYLGYLIARMLHGGFEDTRAALEAHFEQMAAETRKSYAALREQGVTLESLDIPAGVPWVEYAEPRRLPWFVLGRDRVLTATAGTRIALAAHAHRRRHGAFPEAISALVPDFLDEVPADPFSPSREFTYRRSATWSSGSPGPAFILYSVGADGRDDGGIEAVFEDLIAPESEEQGKDLVVTMRLAGDRSSP